MTQPGIELWSAGQLGNSNHYTNGPVDIYICTHSHKNVRRYGIGLGSLFNVISTFFSYPYLPTPPLGQDMTQGQFLSGV